MKTPYYKLLGMNLLALLLGSCEVKQKPAEWTKAKPLTERLDHPDALANDGQFIYFINAGGTVAGQQAGNNNLMKMPIGGGVLGELPHRQQRNRERNHNCDCDPGHTPALTHCNAPTR